MKRLSIIFVSIMIFTLLSGIVHTTITFINIFNDQYTSAPASIAFLFLIPYAIAIIFEGVMWLLLWYIYKKQEKI